MSQQGGPVCPRCGYNGELGDQYCGRCQYAYTRYGIDSPTKLPSNVTPINNQLNSPTIPASYPGVSSHKKHKTTLVVILSAAAGILIVVALFVGVNLGRVTNTAGNPGTVVHNGTPVAGNTPGLPPPTVAPTAVTQPTTQPTPTATQQASSTRVVVQADQAWQDSGVTIPAGKHVKIRYVSGLWNSQSGAFAPFDGAGQPNGYKCTYYFPASQCTEAVPDAVKGSLVGKIGTEVLEIGNELDFVASQGGSLLLRMNDADDGLYDNTGSITVEIDVF